MQQIMTERKLTGSHFQKMISIYQQIARSIVNENVVMKSKTLPDRGRQNQIALEAPEVISTFDLNVTENK